jgi:hypothetical protein
MDLQVGIANKRRLAPATCLGIVAAFAMTIIYMNDCQETQLGRRLSLKPQQDLSPSLMALPSFDQAGHNQCRAIVIKGKETYR